MFKPDSRFLTVDDSKTTRELIRVALTSMGLKNLDEAQNGIVALDKLKRSADDEKKRYALVFCDINMPEMDGLQLLERVRADAKIKDIPFVIVTTEGAKNMVIRAVMQGISGYMVKPFGVDDVKNKVKEIYNRVRLQHDNAAQ